MSNAALPPIPTDAARRAATDVFDRPEFGGRAGEDSFVLRALRDLLQWLGGLIETAPLLFVVLLVGCLIALIALIAVIVLQVRRGFTFGGRDRVAAEEQKQRLRLSASYRDEADRRAAVADFTEAVRYLFLSLVYRFDERGRVSFNGAYTNHEYIDLLHDRLPSTDSLQLLVDTLDDHWYGQSHCDRRRYDECRAVYDRLATA